MSKGTQQMGSPGGPGDAKIASLEGEVRTLKGEVDDLLRKLDEADRQKREAEQKAAAAEAKASDLEKNAEELGRNLAAGRTESERLVAEVTRFQGDFAIAKSAAEAAQDAMAKAEAERAKLAERLESVLADKSVFEKQLVEAIAARIEADSAAKLAFGEKSEVDIARVSAEQALATVKLEAERVEGGLRLRIAGKDREIKDLQDKLLKSYRERK